MRSYHDSRLTKIALVIFFLFVIGYAYFEAQGVLYGPTITIGSQVTLVHEPYIAIRGHAEHIASLSMDGRPISVTEEGAFEEPYVLAPGDNLIILEARDKYSRSSRHIVEIVYTPNSTSPASPAPATTTPVF